ncbi:MAG: PTS sugar transporter subunit IIA [Cellvibrionaceae bacterium]|nr:PTS sugar transporter subunit IIA [Cellvibrionaceae bacterium]
MDITSILSPSRVYCHQEFSSKKRALETIATRFAEEYSHLDSNQIFSALIARERLGSTGLGKGIAIPHCHIHDCQATLGMLMTLKTPIDFDAIDNRPIDIIFVLLVPEGEAQMHLNTLAALAKTLSNEQKLAELRRITSAEKLYQLMVQDNSP